MFEDLFHFSFPNQSQCLSCLHPIDYSPQVYTTEQYFVSVQANVCLPSDPVSPGHVGFFSGLVQSDPQQIVVE